MSVKWINRLQSVCRYEIGLSSTRVTRKTRSELLADRRIFGETTIDEIKAHIVRTMFRPEVMTMNHGAESSHASK